MNKAIVILCLCLPVLTACSGLKQQLGLTRRTPDEFAVVKRAPLTIPPDLDRIGALPVPSPGMQRPQETSPEQDARAALLQGNIPASTQASPGETSLLNRAGAADASPAIRKTVDRETYENASKSRPVYKRILSIGDKNDAGGASVVDAPAEAKRIKTGKAGDTPSIEE